MTATPATEPAIDLVEERVDVAIRFSEQIEDTSVVARKLASNERVVCAAPSYIAANGEPRRPQDLLLHNCLRLSTVTRWNDWEFEDERGRRTVHVAGNFSTNSADADYHAALAGVGIARLSTYLVAEDLRAGRLMPLLTDHKHHDSDLLAVYPDRRHLALRVRVFIDFLAAHLGQVPPWERDGCTG